MPTLPNFDAATQDDVDTLANLLGGMSAAGDATFKITVEQLALSMLRPSLLATVPTNEITAAAHFLVQDAGIVGGRSNRYLTLAQMVALMHARTGQIMKLQPIAKVGTTAGWVVGAANNIGRIATLPAGQAGSTLVLPIAGFKVGTIITRFTLNGSMQSAGNAVNITAALRKLTNAAAGAADGLVEAFAAPVAGVANTKLSVLNATLALAVPYTIIEDESLYLLITSTTGAACTQELESVDVTVTTV